MYKHILLPTNGSEHSRRTIQSGIEFAKALGARVTGLFVGARTYIPAVDGAPEPVAKQALAAFKEQAEEAGVTSECISVLGDSPAEAIINCARSRRCDLIVMGTRGRSNVGKFLLGSTPAAVIEDCEIPVLLVR